MNKQVVAILTMALAPVCAFAVDGVTLINQSTVMAAGGYPYTITQPGSYKLSGSLLAPGGVNGIVISASNVTLDLNGFTISAPPQASCLASCDTPLFGVTTGTNPVTGVRVRNGIISGFGGQLSLESVTNGVAEDLTLIFVSGGVLPFGGSQFAATSLVRHVTTNGALAVTCPSVVVESVALEVFTTGNQNTCALANNINTN